MGNHGKPLHVVCAACRTVNRLAPDRVEEAPSCGRCGADLLAGKPVTLTEADFGHFAERNDLPVLVDFWAAWCGPCKTMAPQFESAARTLAGKIQLAKVDSDSESRLAARFAIRSIPTMILLSHGREIDRISGALPANRIVSWALAGAARAAP